MEARDASGRPPRFPQSLYRGTVAVGSGVGAAVKDAAAPSQPLRVWAQDPEFPVGTAWPLVWGGVGGHGGSLGPGPTGAVSVQDLNSAITYRVTNNSNFRMHGEEVLTATPPAQAGVFYAEVRGRQPLPGAGLGEGPQRDEPHPAPGGGHQHGDIGHSSYSPADRSH